jgi:flagellar assembly protein FliH
MSEQDTLPPRPKKLQKFMFDVHDFNDDAEDIIEEDAPPPPPVFSEQEMADSRQNGYEAGKQDGLTEAHAGFARQVTAILEVIARDIQTLFQAEQEREAKYETEIIAITDVILKTIFPALSKKHGLDEITNMIETVVKTQKEQKEIIITVHEDYVEAVTEKTADLAGKAQLDGILKIESGGDNVAQDDCRLSWHRGGAVRDISTLSAQIQKELEQLLAGRPRLDNNDSDNIDDDPDTSAPDADAPSTSDQGNE